MPYAPPARLCRWTLSDGRSKGNVRVAGANRRHQRDHLCVARLVVNGNCRGSDTRTPWDLGIYAGSVLLVGGLLGVRLLTPVGTRGRAYPNLAGLVGTTRETLNKWLGFYETQGLIRWDKGQITVRRPEALRKRIY